MPIALRVVTKVLSPRNYQSIFYPMPSIASHLLLTRDPIKGIWHFRFKYVPLKTLFHWWHIHFMQRRWRWCSCWLLALNLFNINCTTHSILASIRDVFGHLFSSVETLSVESYPTSPTYRGPSIHSTQLDHHTACPEFHLCNLHSYISVWLLGPSRHSSMSRCIMASVSFAYLGIQCNCSAFIPDYSSFLSCQSLIAAQSTFCVLRIISNYFSPCWSHSRDLVILFGRLGKVLSPISLHPGIQWFIMIILLAHLVESIFHARRTCSLLIRIGSHIASSSETASIAQPHLILHLVESSKVYVFHQGGKPHAAIWIPA